MAEPLESYYDGEYASEIVDYVAHAPAVFLNGTSYSVCRCYQEIRHDNHYQMYNFFTIIITVPIVATFGLVTNVFNFTIFSRSPMSLFSGNVYLAALAVSDFLVVFTGLFIIWMDSARTYAPLLNHFFVKCLPILTIGNMSQTCSVYFTVGAATDCFVRVCCSSPRNSRWCRPKTAIIVIAGIVVFAVSYNCVQFWAMNAQLCINELTGTVQYEICPTKLMMKINEAYNVYATAILLTFLPFFLLCILNGFIIYRLRTNKRARSAHICSQVRERLTRVSGDDTVTMIMVIVLFLGCNILGLLINAVETFTDAPAIVIHYMADMSNLLVTFNSSLNFCIYVAFDKSYRTIFVQRFCCLPIEPDERMVKLSLCDGSLYNQTSQNGFVLTSTAICQNPRDGGAGGSNGSLDNDKNYQAELLGSWKSSRKNPTGTVTALSTTAINNNNDKKHSTPCYVPCESRPFAPLSPVRQCTRESRAASIVTYGSSPVGHNNGSPFEKYGESNRHLRYVSAFDDGIRRYSTDSYR